MQWLVSNGSPRWTSGSPRMLLLVLVREFESRRGDVLKLFAKTKKKGSTAEIVYCSVGKHNSTRVDEGRKNRNLLAIKMQGTYRGGEGGGEEPDT